jgi:hypothetical protein
MAHTIEQKIIQAKKEYLTSLRESMLKVIDQQLKQCDIEIKVEQRKIHYDNDRN